MNERQVLEITNLPASKFLKLQAVSGSVQADITPASTTAQWKTAIESLPEYISGTATVTFKHLDGSGSALATSSDATTSETLYSGIVRVDFGGEMSGKNVPQLVLYSGEVHRVSISGAATTGSYNGAGLDVGDTAADFQAALRLTGDPFANAVVKGTSS